MDENLVYFAEAGVKGTWSGKALKKSYLAWDLREVGPFGLSKEATVSGKGHQMCDGTKSYNNPMCLENSN